MAGSRARRDYANEALFGVSEYAKLGSYGIAVPRGRFSPRRTFCLENGVQVQVNAALESPETREEV